MRIRVRGVWDKTLPFIRENELFVMALCLVALILNMKLGMGPTGVIMGCGVATLGVGMVGLTLYGTWTEPGEIATRQRHETTHQTAQRAGKMAAG